MTSSEAGDTRISKTPRSPRLSLGYQFLLNIAHSLNDREPRHGHHLIVTAWYRWHLSSNPEVMLQNIAQHAELRVKALLQNQLLNNVLDEPPTVENLLKWLAHQLDLPQYPEQLFQVDIDETHKNRGTWLKPETQ